MNPRDVLNKRFEKGFGYKQEEVDSYLREVSAALAAALKDRDEQEAKIIKLVDKINEYRSDESAIGNALLVAQKQASRIIAEAKEEASKLVSEAQARRDAMIAEITSDCETIKRSQIEKIAVAVSQESAKLEAVKALAISARSQAFSVFYQNYQQNGENVLSLPVEETLFSYLKEDALPWSEEEKENILLWIQETEGLLLIDEDAPVSVTVPLAVAEKLAEDGETAKDILLLFGEGTVTSFS